MKLFWSRIIRGGLVAGLTVAGNTMIDNLIGVLPTVLAGTKYATVGGIALLVVNGLRDLLFKK